MQWPVSNQNIGNYHMRKFNTDRIYCRKSKRQSHQSCGQTRSGCAKIRGQGTKDEASQHDKRYGETGIVGWKYYDEESTTATEGPIYARRNIQKTSSHAGTCHCFHCSYSSQVAGTEQNDIAATKISLKMMEGSIPALPAPTKLASWDES
jgi:hypothetical protein